MGWTPLSARGSRPSRAMEKKMRLCPKMRTSNTVVRPARAPIEMIVAAQFSPTWIMACATGEALLSCLYGTIPVRMPATAM